MDSYFIPWNIKSPFPNKFRKILCVVTLNIHKMKFQVEMKRFDPLFIQPDIGCMGLLKHD